MIKDQQLLKNTKILFFIEINDVFIRILIILAIKNIMNFIGQNIKYLRKVKGITQEQLSGKLGLNRSMIGAYEENRAEPKMQTILNLCHYFEVDINSLILSNLSKTDSSKKNIDIEGKQLRILPILINKEENNELISVVPVKASAGYMNGYGDVDFIESLQKFTLPVPEISPNKTYRVFQISGDSMLPVKPGSYIICEYVHDWYDIRNDQCYILITRDDGIVYKRVINNLKDAHLLLKSDNKEYQPYKITPDKIMEVWKALGYITFSLPDAEENYLNKNHFEEIIQGLKNDVHEIKRKIQDDN